MIDIPNDEAKIAELDNWVLVNGSIRRALRAAIDYGRETRSISASRDQVIEECAIKCDEASDLHANGEDWIDAAEYCAIEIRTLKTLSPTPEKPK